MVNKSGAKIKTIVMDINYKLVESSYDILNEITEIRTCCGFRENMIQEANRPCDEVAFNWPSCMHLECFIQDVMYNRNNDQEYIYVFSY